MKEVEGDPADSEGLNLSVSRPSEPPSYPEHQGSTKLEALLNKPIEDAQPAAPPEARPVNSESPPPAVVEES